MSELDSASVRLLRIHTIDWLVSQVCRRTTVVGGWWFNATCDALGGIPSTFLHMVMGANADTCHAKME